jgi:RNA polymerase sigma factor (sigma-70 family)
MDTSHSETSHSITLLINQLFSQDAAIRSQAETAIYARFSPMLLAWLARRLAPGVRRREGPEDIVNAAFYAAFESLRLRQGRGELAPQDRTALKKLLRAIAYRMLCNAVEWHSAQRRDYRRERIIALAEARGGDSSSAWMLLDEVPAPRSPQEMQSLLEEALEPILKALHDPDLQEITRRCLEEETTGEIAERLGLTQRTVQRRIKAIRRKLNWLKPGMGGPEQ